MSRVVSIAVVSILLVILSLGCVGVWYATRDPLPREIRIAAGKQDGLYHTFAQHLALKIQKRTGHPVRVIETAGTEENIGLLQEGGTELALIQTISLTPKEVAGIAPLFPEPVHLIVRDRTKKVESPSQLGGKNVSLGLPGSGMRINSHTLLAHYDVPLAEVHKSDAHFAALATDSELDAALITTGWMNPQVAKLLQNPDLKLIGIPDPDGLAARHPWFVPTTIPRGLYPAKTPVPAEPVRTVAVTALLAGRADCSDQLVRETLAAIYETDLRASFPVVLSAKAAKDYDTAVMHPSVARYHDPSAGFARLSRALEIIAKSKEVLLALVAFGLLVWGWVRRHRERLAAEADQAQKQKLDEFIRQTLAVELQQMEVAEPEQLRVFLRRVTQIKQAALQELTSEKVRGDQLFAIFLSQCAALSEKIQMRMMYARMSEVAEKNDARVAP
ncbi:MAG: TAXI family TRAP transporter solute-binding subunit [Gemmataceae bacterium]